MRLPFRAVLAALAAAAPGLAALALPQTTAERTDYAATSTNAEVGAFLDSLELAGADRKSTRLNSSHLVISYAVFCLKKKKRTRYNHVDHNIHPPLVVLNAITEVYSA